MASLVLGAVGSAAGPSLFGAGFTAFGLSISGAQIGGALGALAGSLIDSALMPGTHVNRTGPRLSDVNIQASTEGAPIPRVFGRMRVAGQLIWATKFRETETTTETGGGKGFGGGVSVSETDYTYSISFAVGLCEGVTSHLGRVWADGNLIDLSQFTTRFYRGDESQLPDPLIETVEGAGNTPAYRGLSYVVFEDLPLARFGNRIPQLQFEVFRALSADRTGALENRMTAACLIPGAGEFVYAEDIVASDDGAGTTLAQNAHNAAGVADLTASLDQLQALAPNLSAVSLVTGWFGSDLRAGHCTVKPGVEADTKNTYPQGWSVNGVARADAHLVSRIDGKPAYGGTPSDESVVQAIAALKARGLQVMFAPFLFMDIPSGNALPDPYTGEGAQPAFPWRGRIACDPAPGVAGSPDKTAAATAQIDAFFGGATPSGFAVNGTSVSWAGGGDWGYRRMVLHYAHLCAASGGVDWFLIGSELRGLTRTRDGAASYPAVAQLRALAADVRTILGPATKIGYAADWSEYNAHQTGDAPGALLFHLDPLWADANIDFVGIDNYLPLADWRDGVAQADYDALNGPVTPHDAAYLAANIEGGEYYDWFYADTAARNAQLRTAVSDGLGKPWVWRAKDLRGWWENAHYNRADGMEAATRTAWEPQSKPILFCELGCPAVDRGANQPNVFVDAKSAESALPYFSHGTRDDLIQRRVLEAQLNHWADPAHNPMSAAYGAPMVEADHTFLWCWDARPFPFFPARADVWGDAPNYRLGHWLNGRLGAVSLADLVAALCEDAGFTAYDVSGLDGLVTGYAVTDTMSPRDTIAPLALAYGFDGIESEGQIKFVMRGRQTADAVSEADLVLPSSGAAEFGYALTRAQETDLPNTARIAYSDADADYRQAVAESRRLVTHSDRVAVSHLPLVLDQGQAIAIAARQLQEAWAMRETARLSLPPSHLALDPGDDIVLRAGGRDTRLRITAIEDGAARAIEAAATDPSLYEIQPGPQRLAVGASAPAFTGRALLVFADLPLLRGDEVPWAPYVGAFASPWPGAVAVLKSAGESGFTLDTRLTRAAVIGETIVDFPAAPPWVWDDVNTLHLHLFNGTLSSKGDLAVLGGENVLAIENEAGAWEVLQFGRAVLTGPDTWALSHLLRGQAGTESAMRAPLAAGARVVLIDGALKQLSLRQADSRLPFHYLWGPQDKPISDPAFQGAEKTFAAVGLRPYAPCHVRAHWAGGDLELSWLRRDRAPASDDWGPEDIPLSEQVERYALEILGADGAVLRAVENLTTPSFTYPAPDIASDFPGGLPQPFRIRIYQISAVTGRGAPADAALAPV